MKRTVGHGAQGNVPLEDCKGGTLQWGYCTEDAGNSRGSDAPLDENYVQSISGDQQARVIKWETFSLINSMSTRRLKSIACGIALLAGSLMICGFAQDKNGGIHAQIIKEGLGNQFSATNLDIIINASESQDAAGSEGAKEPRRHFDAKTLQSSLAYIDREKKKILNYAQDADSNPNNRARVLHHLGLMLHTVQDFYSRSNYVELRSKQLKGGKLSNPYDMELVDWSKLPEGYDGGGEALGVAEVKKENPEDGGKPLGPATHYKVARELAIRETQRQWTSLESLIRNRYQNRASLILTALKEASCPSKIVPEPDEI